MKALGPLAVVQYWRRKLCRWRLALVTSVWLIGLSNTVLELADGGLVSDSTLWPALAVASALAGMGGLALTAWFWVRRDRPSGTAVGTA